LNDITAWHRTGNSQWIRPHVRDNLVGQKSRIW
jgi:hypothetical protein